jgi:hypothetical protein
VDSEIFVFVLVIVDGSEVVFLRGSSVVQGGHCRPRLGSS